MNWLGSGEERKQGAEESSWAEAGSFRASSPLNGLSKDGDSVVQLQHGKGEVKKERGKKGLQKRTLKPTGG